MCFFTWHLASAHFFLNTVEMEFVCLSVYLSVFLFVGVSTYLSQPETDWETSLVYKVQCTLYMPHLVGVHVQSKGVKPSADSLSIPLLKSAA